MARQDPGVNLYSRKVLIQQKAEKLLPEWMRFLKVHSARYCSLCGRNVTSAYTAPLQVTPSQPACCHRCQRANHHVNL